MPGRLQKIDDDPLTLLDGAHNPDGIEALVESLPEIVAGRERLVAVVSILDDKDAIGMLPRSRESVIRSCHEQSESPGFATADTPVTGRPARRSALRNRSRSTRRAGSRPRARRPPGCCAGDRVDLPCGGPGRACRASTGIDVVTEPVGALNDRDEHPSFLTMIGLVALIVAVVILVFFGIGYLFGRIFL